MDTTAPTIRLCDAAAAAGIELRHLRALLADVRLSLLNQPVPEPGQHIRACAVDVLRFAIFRRLRQAGLNAAQAAYALDLSVDPHLVGLCLSGVAVPSVVLSGRLAGAVVHVIPDEGDEMPDVYSTPSGLPEAEDAPVAVTINLSAVLADVLARLTQTKDNT